MRAVCWVGKLRICLAVLGTNIGTILNGLLVPISLNSLLFNMLCKLCKQLAVFPNLYGSYAAIDCKGCKITCRLTDVPLYGVESVATVC